VTNRVVVQWDDGWHGPMRFHDVTLPVVYSLELGDLSKRLGLTKLAAMGIAGIPRRWYTVQEGLVVIERLTAGVANGESGIDDAKDCADLLDQFKELAERLQMRTHGEAKFRFKVY
jgi:hypothetical protein